MKISKKAAGHLLRAMMHHNVFKEKLANGDRDAEGKYEYVFWAEMRDENLKKAGLPSYDELEKLEKGA